MHFLTLISVIKLFISFFLVSKSGSICILSWSSPIIMFLMLLSASWMLAFVFSMSTRSWVLCNLLLLNGHLELLNSLSQLVVSALWNEEELLARNVASKNPNHRLLDRLWLVQDVDHTDGAIVSRREKNLSSEEQSFVTFPQWDLNVRSAVNEISFWLSLNSSQ